MNARAAQQLVHGRMIGLDPGERERFFAYAYRTTHDSRTLLSFGLPLLFLVGWLRDYAVMPDLADQTLLRRLLLVSALLGLAAVIRWRGLRHWREVAGVAYVCLYSAGITMTTLAEPARFSLTHVAAMLMTIILLPHALRPVAMVATLVALAAPLGFMLDAFDASPSLWIAYAAFVLVGSTVGLAQRRAYLDSALGIFELRKRLLARLQLDALTGTLNRDGWAAQLRLHMQRNAAENRPVSVVYFDLDHFKAINDRVGHATGDEVLRCTADVIRLQSRPGELVARLGGEEFVALLPGTTEADAFRYADRIRGAIERHAGAVPMTLSAGVAQHQAGAQLETTIERADAALLEAKRLGRNRVVRASTLD